MGNRFRHTLAVMQVIEVPSKLKDWKHDATLIEQGAWPTEYDHVGTSVIHISTVETDVPPPIEVPKGCSERDKYIYDNAFVMAETFRNGNKEAMLSYLKELPPLVAMAVVARITQEEPDLGVAEYLNEVA